jgi:hypothetical protein
MLKLLLILLALIDNEDKIIMKQLKNIILFTRNQQHSISFQSRITFKIHFPHTQLLISKWTEATETLSKGTLIFLH